MAIAVTRESGVDISGPWRVWEDPCQLDLLDGSWFLVARRGTQVVGTWLVPIEPTPVGPVARREIRLLPYASPRLLEADPRRRRDVCGAMFAWLQNETVGVELPFPPDFHDLGAVSEHGGFVESRMTHVVDDVETFLRTQSRRCKNEISAARRQTTVSTHKDLARFDFDSAIVSTLASHRQRRAALAEALGQRGSCLVVEAGVSGKVVGQAVVARSGSYALVMHSWHDRGCGIRGIPTLLIHEIVMAELARPDTTVVDLEGSVLATVDYFMDGTGASPVPHALVYWYSDRGTLLQRLQMSLDIPGRQR